MPEKPDRSTVSDELFEKVLASIIQAKEAGKPVDLSRIVAKHPELGPRLHSYFDNLAAFERVARPATPPAAPSTVTLGPPDLTPGSEFAGYQILHHLGRGGMGVVYLARQQRPNRLVALKLIRMDRLAHLSARQRGEWLTRFRKEAEAAARIADGVVMVHEVGVCDGRPFYSMRYIGRSLASLLDEGPLSNRKAALVMEQVARTMQAVHDQKVLHRDLKPHNIFLDAQGRPYVGDFGLAKLLDAADSQTDTGVMLGSPEYMPRSRPRMPPMRARPRTSTAWEPPFTLC